jgi:hypothetical protein
VVAAVSIPAGVVAVVQDRRGAKAAAIDGMLKSNTNSAKRRMIPTHCYRSRLSTPKWITDSLGDLLVLDTNRRLLLLYISENAKHIPFRILQPKRSEPSMVGYTQGLRFSVVTSN